MIRLRWAWVIERDIHHLLFSNLRELGKAWQWPLDWFAPNFSTWAVYLFCPKLHPSPSSCSLIDSTTRRLACVFPCYNWNGPQILLHQNLSPFWMCTQWSDGLNPKVRWKLRHQNELNFSLVLKFEDGLDSPCLRGWSLLPTNLTLIDDHWKPIDQIFSQHLALIPLWFCLSWFQLRLCISNCSLNVRYLLIWCCTILVFLFCLQGFW